MSAKSTRNTADHTPLNSQLPMLQKIQNNFIWNDVRLGD